MTKKFSFYFKSSKIGMNEIQKRVLFVFAALIVFRVGSLIPISGIDTVALGNFVEQQKGTVVEIFNVFSGGALNRASILALGIMPYISSSIVVQLLTIINKRLSEIKKDGEEGRRKINEYIRYGTFFLALFQSIGMAVGLPSVPGVKQLIIDSGFKFYSVAICSLVTGTVFLMWLGEQITEKGIGNGVSVIIFAGIVSGIPSSINRTIEEAKQGKLNFLLLLLIVCSIFLITFFVVFIEHGQRKILVSYAKRQKGRRMYAAQNTYLPLKVNMSGVIPAIFASSVILFPSTILSWFFNSIGVKFFSFIFVYLHPGHPVYIMVYSISIIFFCFFYTALIFSPRETAENLKKSGAFIPGIRPGEKTAKYIDKIMTRLTCIGSMYITLICLMPEFMRNIMRTPFHFGGTSLLIVVVVIIDFMSQIQTLIMSSQYENILKKINLKIK